MFQAAWLRGVTLGTKGVGAARLAASEGSFSMYVPAPLHLLLAPRLR